MNNTLKFNASIQSDTLEYVNKDFSKAECKVMYVGANRNNSYISKESVNKNLETIFNVPVVAETIYKEDDDKDFGTHGGRIIMDSNGIKYEETTVPYGVVPESANPRWVDDGDKEYLVCDILLWTGRYEDLEILLDDEEKSRPQSMEIKIDSSFIDEDGYEVIEDFDFSALTILGSDVEPCFEDAKVKMYELDDFKALYNEMIEAYSKISMKGGKDLDETTKKDMSKPSPDEEIIEDFDKDEGEEDMTKEKEEKFELSYKDKWDILYNALSTDEDSYVWVLDFTNSYVDYEIDTFENDTYEYKLYRASYELNEETKEVNIDFENQEELFRELVTKSEKETIESNRQMALDTLNEKIDKLEEQVEDFTTKNDELKSELEKEKSFRLEIEEEERKEKIENVLKSFEKLLSKNPEFAALKDKAFDLELDEIEKECYILIGKENFEKNGGKLKDDTKVYTKKNYDLEGSSDDEEDINKKIIKDYTK